MVYIYVISPEGVGKSHRRTTIDINKIMYTFIDQNQIGFNSSELWTVKL